MDLHVSPVPIPPPISLSTQSLWVFPVHQARALVSCIQPGLAYPYVFFFFKVYHLFFHQSWPQFILMFLFPTTDVWNKAVLLPFPNVQPCFTWRDWVWFIYTWDPKLKIFEGKGQNEIAPEDRVFCDLGILLWVCILLWIYHSFIPPKLRLYCWAIHRRRVQTRDSKGFFLCEHIYL